MISRSLIRLRRLKVVRVVRGFHARVKTSHIVLAVTSAQVRKQLVQEEEVAARLGEFLAHDVSPSILIHTGMELEEYQ
jgi:hypothetical protein